MKSTNNAVQPTTAKRWIAIACVALVVFAAVWGSMFVWVDVAARHALYDSGQPDRAIRLLERWSPWVGSPARWRWLLAESYRKAGDRGRVQRMTDSLAASGLDSVRASGPLRLMDASAGAPSRVKETLGPLLISYGNRGSEVLAAMTQGFLTQGDTATANQTLRLWGELYEDDYQLEFWRGVLATLNYDLDDAVKAFQKSVALNPNDSRARQELAEVYLEQAKFEEARAEYEWLIQHFPDTPERITSYSRCLLNLGYPEKAAAELQKLTEVSQLPSPELSLVCETNLEAGRVQEASDQAAILLKRWPDALPYLQLQARCMAKLGNSSESEALFAKAATSQTQRPEVDRMLERLALDGRNQELRRDLGEKMMTYLDPPGGAGYLQIASRANPNDLRSHQLLERYYEREGNFQSAEVQRWAIRQIEFAISQQQAIEETAGDPNFLPPQLPGPGAENR